MDTELVLWITITYVFCSICFFFHYPYYIPHEFGGHEIYPYLAPVASGTGLSEWDDILALLAHTTSTKTRTCRSLAQASLSNLSLLFRRTENV